jgi:WD40 repeat protein
MLASGSNDKTVKVWDARTGKVKRSLRGHNGKDGCICKDHLLGAVNPQCPVTGPSACVSSVAFSADGQWVMSGSGDKTIRLWDAHD